MTRNFRDAVIDALVHSRGDGHVTVALARDIRHFVDQQIKGMPVHLRAGVGATEALLSVTTLGGTGSKALSPRLPKWTRSRLPPIASYFRLMRGLVVFAMYELGEP